MEFFKADIAIDAGYILRLDESKTQIEDGTILIKDHDFLYVGPRLSREQYDATEYIDGKTSVVLPPFYNQHTHPSLSLYRGLGVDMSLQDWLQKVIWPLEKEFCDPEMVYLGSQLSILEMIRSGTGAVATMDFHTKAVGKAFEEAGLRAYIGEALFSSPTQSCQTPEDGYNYIESLLEEYYDSDLIHIYMAIHAPFTSTPELFRETSKRAKEWGIISTSHIAETKKEVDWSLKTYGKTPVQLIESTGILETDFILVHGVHLTDSDIKILKDNQIPVIHNPHSNMVLGSGVCRVPSLLEQNMEIGLGTDSAASNNNLSMMREMQTLAKLHKVIHKDASLIPAPQALRMATTNGYRIYRHQRMGQITEGYKADLQIIDLTGMHNIPTYDIISTLVYSAHSDDVTGLIVNGRILMKDRNVLCLDEEKILNDCRKKGVEIADFMLERS
ncbi:MAG: amidohydrolase [Bacteroidota bacterium]|nr:amidohydrolase [Bacteroidota bacterium]